LFQASLADIILPLLIPLAPKDIISIPAIRRVPVNTMTNRTKPILIGLAIMISDIAMLNTPTPIIKPLENLGISLDIPCTILAIPLISKATAPRITKNADVTTGNCIRKIESPTIANPSTMFVIRVFFDERGDNPTATLSIPTIKNTMDRINIRVNKVAPGKTTKNDRTTTESKIAREPKIICNIRSHGGDLNVCNWRIEPTLAYISDDLYRFLYSKVTVEIFI
jgi:hypothetical protein